MDTSLFIYHYGDIKIFVLIYVDDIIVTGTHLEFINSLISRLQLEFPLKDIGPLSFFLGIQATRTEHGLHFCQAKYIADLLTRFHMIRAKAAKSPCPLAPNTHGMMVKVYLILQNIVMWLSLYSIVHLQGLRFPL